MGDKFTSLREIAQLNIERYSKLLQTSLDEVTRTTVEKLLANEKAKLAMVPDKRHFPAAAGLARKPTDATFFAAVSRHRGRGRVK